MINNQEVLEVVPFSHPLQAEATECYMAWERMHSLDDRTGVKTHLIEPGSVPEHDINVGLVELKQSTLEMPGEEFFKDLRINLAQLMGSIDQADRIVDDLRSAHTSRNNTTPLLQTMEHVLGQGKNIGILLGHQKLGDVGIGSSAVAVAINKTPELRRLVVFLNRAKTYGAIGDRTFTDRLTDFSNVVLVSPITETSKKLGIPKEIEDHVNFVAGRALHPFTKRGAMVAVALHGTGLKPLAEGASLEQGQRIPKMDYSSARLTEKLDYFLRFAIWKDLQTGEHSWDIGPLEPKLSAPEGRMNQEQRKRRNSLVADKQQRALAQSLEKLSGTRIVYEELVPSEEIGAIALANPETS